MALKEQDVVLYSTDADGNKVIQMPITRVDNVEGAVSLFATKTELTNGLGGKSNSGHTHNYVSKNGDTVSGNLTVTGTLWASAFQSTSDIRKKSELKEIESCLDKLGTLTAYTYNLDDDDSGRRAGLIAQDLERALPEAVREDEDGFLSLDYNGVIALLLGAVKELREEVRLLKNDK